MPCPCSARTRGLAFLSPNTVQLGIHFYLVCKVASGTCRLCLFPKSSKITTEDLRTCSYKLRQRSVGINWPEPVIVLLNPMLTRPPIVAVMGTIIQISIYLFIYLRLLFHGQLNLAVLQHQKRGLIPLLLPCLPFSCLWLCCPAPVWPGLSPSCVTNPSGNKFFFPSYLVSETGQRIAWQMLELVQSRWGDGLA